MCWIWNGIGIKFPLYSWPGRCGRARYNALCRNIRHQFYLKYNLAKVTTDKQKQQAKFYHFKKAKINVEIIKLFCLVSFSGGVIGDGGFFVASAYSGVGGAPLVADIATHKPLN